VRAFVSSVLYLAGLAQIAGATTFTPVTIPTSNNIQTGLISSVPTGTLTANNSLATPFNIPSAAGTCGPAGNQPCNFYDGFGFSGSGQSITMNVNVANATDVYTLMNAYDPAGGQELASITFNGTGGTSLTLDLIGGEVIRDFYQGSFTNTLTNGVAGVNALNAFTCVRPSTCLGAGGSGNVQTGLNGTYVIDEQDFSLGNVFQGQTLTSITITDTHNGSDPILLAATVGSASSVAAPEPSTVGLLVLGVVALSLLGARQSRLIRS